jgi:hypothetical protein
MDFLYQREGGMVFYHIFLLSPLQCTVEKLKRFCEFEEKRLREFEEIETQGKAVEVTVNSKEENSEDFCLDFVQEFSLGQNMMAVVLCV